MVLHAQLSNDACMTVTTDEQTVMLREIAMQPEFIRASTDAMYAQVCAALAAQSDFAMSSGFTIGCGDSFCSAVATRSYMIATTKHWFEPIEAFEFAHYLVDSLPSDSVVIGVSNSGTVARTIDGIRRARDGGARTLAVTAGTQNELARTAQTVIDVNAVPNIKVQPDGTKLVTPGTITYIASLLGLCVGAVALSERLGVLAGTAAAAAMSELRRLADLLADADAPVKAEVNALVETLTPERTLVIVGGGPNAATAYYGMAKFYEAVQWPVLHADVEEWAHVHYFVTGPNTDTIVIAPPGRSRDRALEQVRAAREMGSRTIVIGARSDSAARRAADYFIALPDNIPETLTPFVYALPFQYLACGLARRHNTSFFNFNDALRQQVNFRQIFNPARQPGSVAPPEK